MSTKLLMAAAGLLAVLCGPALAGQYARHVSSGAYASVAWPAQRSTPAASEAQGQYPAPPELAARSALPACGFAAIESFGPNGFQYCDARNVHGGAW
jgi:hypothetical protein